ncbi:hypothetical protein OGAPHI_005925 [Ogataea philodendri]|uniref:Amino acid permease/ SLC12A domain-containing protein n=1 Tax=Ogataea philodendri TaxID=1378263 RepID=A0A9P8NYE1_9ASCO|nr:uncharacterized protein OGAPHI_005925 [Ogataea philodendri]KAH3661747.1 hypothetical protein OGAPHI_005925 [Ogataea philodendri]
MKAFTIFKDIFIPVPPVKAAGKSQAGHTVEAISSTAVPAGASGFAKDGDKEADINYDVVTDYSSDLDIYDIGHTHRRLKNRHIQLIGIGGTIGVALFVSVSSQLHKSGPLGLLLGCIIWCMPILAVTAACAEMVCYLPIPSPFIRLAERCVDESFSFMTGWNFWVLECSLIPFELTLFNTLIHYWRDDYSAAIPIAVELALYFLINVSAVKYYGEAEFWLSLGKVILAVGLMVFTFITMVGGNPLHDVYGFRNWQPPMAEYIHTGNLGRFQGLLGAMITYSFLIAGPEYVSMSAGEVINPRIILPSAYKQVAYRLTIFFVGGALAMGTVCFWNDPGLAAAIEEGKPGAGSSAYIVAMNNMKVKILPDIVNVMLLTSAFSAGNSYTFCSSRSLYGMALEGKAPRLFSHCNKAGVPIYAVLLSTAWGLLAFLQLSESSATVLNWIVNLVTASQMINFVSILITYLHFRRAVLQQGIDRSAFRFKAWGQPYISIAAAIAIICMIGVQGYEVFLPGGWSVETFLFSYLMVFIDIALFVGWKLLKRTKYINPMDVDLVSGLDEIEAHEKLLAHERSLYGREKEPWYNRVVDFIFGNPDQS